VAERRARWVRLAMNLVLGFAAVLGFVAFMSWGQIVGHPHLFHGARGARAADALQVNVSLVLALVLVAAALSRVVDRLTRHATTPLPPPAVDPLATYREGPPVECPRHPFAR